MRQTCWQIGGGQFHGQGFWERNARKLGGGESDCCKKLPKKTSTIKNPGRDISESTIAKLPLMSFLPLREKVEGVIADKIATMKLGKNELNPNKEQLEQRQKGKGGKEKCVRCMFQLPYSRISNALIFILFCVNVDF